MRNTAYWIGALVLLPALLLSFLAWRSASDQRTLLQEQERRLRAQEVERFASKVRLALYSEYEAFVRETNRYIESDPATPFDRFLQTRWNAQAEAWIAEGDGQLRFPEAHSPEGKALLNSLPTRTQNAPDASSPTIAEAEPTIRILNRDGSFIVGYTTEPVAAGETEGSDLPASGLAAAFEGEPRGILSDIRNGKAELIFWLRSPDDDTIYAARIRPDAFTAAWESLRIESPGNDSTFAILDRQAEPVYSSTPDQLPTSAPFTTSAFGDILPGWTAALYLKDADTLERSADRLKWTLLGLIGTAFLAIFTGVFLLAADNRRQRDLALKKTQFVSNVTHELKTPLTAISLYSEMLEAKLDDSQETPRRFARTIAAETDRLKRLIDQVLDFSRLEKNSQTYRMERIDLCAWLESFRTIQEPTLQEGEATLALDLPPDPCFVRADPDALSQIFLNLVANALKYAGPRAAIEIHLRSTGDRVVVDVMDRGPGVPRGEEEKIFEQFYRADNNLDAETQGTGLGLTLARGLVLDHDGEIRYHHREGGGSIFSVNLPRFNPS